LQWIFDTIVLLDVRFLREKEQIYSETNKLTFAEQNRQVCLTKN